jgi:tRNA pseudouridine38-40 synthase
MGVLLPIGEGKRPASWMKQVLEAKNRCAAGVTALPQGLYLVEVGYPSDYAIPKVAVGPDFLLNFESKE